MRLLVGLGNPGAKYERTRHNLGFRIAQLAAEKLGMALDQTRWNAVLGTGRVRGEQIAIVLPQTFMNLSGDSVGHAARFWKVDPGDVVVAHDDLDLTLARIQVKVGGGDGGHNGLKSLREHVGTRDFVRVRFGVGRPPAQWEGAGISKKLRQSIITQFCHSVYKYWRRQQQGIPPRPPDQYG